MFKEYLKESGLNEGYNYQEKNLALSKIQEYLESADDVLLLRL